MALDTQEKSNAEITNDENIKKDIIIENESDIGSGKIYATGIVGTWALMAMIGSTDLLSGLDVKDGVKMEICHTKGLTTEATILIQNVISGLISHKEIKRTEEGLGGTYFFMNRKDKAVAIFKPCDEEPLAPFNPKGFIGRSLGDPGLKPTIRVGEAALREVAAYLLDRSRFSKVPTTLLVRASHPQFENGTDFNDTKLKVGSLQEFIPHICDATEMGTSKFCSKDVHRIGILDVRLFNTDRHAGNILVKKADHTDKAYPRRLGESQFELIPIDHGFCLPEALEPPYFEWQYWPQARIPFDNDELKYIAEIDIEADKELLRREIPVLREECLRIMELSTTLLKRGASAGLSLSDIANVMSRPIVGINAERSDFEKICIETREHLESIVGSFIETSSMSFNIKRDSDSDADISSEALSKAEDLQFTIDDLKDLDVISGSNSTHTNANLDSLTSFFHVANSISSTYSSSDLLTAMTRLSSDLDKSSININTSSITTNLTTNLTTNMNITDPPSSSFVLIGQTSTHRSLSLAPLTTALPPALSSKSKIFRSQTPRIKVSYPPLLSSGNQGDGVDVISGLDEDQWKIFMKIFETRIDEALSCGQWVSTRAESFCRSQSICLGVSCPRF